MLEIDQVHLRAVMLFMSETSEIVIIFRDRNNLQYTQYLMVWLKSPKSQLSKTFFGLKFH